MKNSFPNFPLTVSTSVHQMPCVEIRNPTKWEQRFLSRCMRDNWMDSPYYQARHPSGAFLQADYPDYILIEFWQREYQGFVDFMNAQYQKWYSESHAHYILEDV